jgi:NADH-quinone oxidoreductase subunit C
MNIAKPLDPVTAVQNTLPGVVKNVVKFRDEITLVVDPAQIVSVVEYLRDTAGLVYNYLSDISAVDYWEPSGTHGDRPARFGVCYHLYSMLYARRIRVKVYLDEDEPVVPSVIGVWPAANWLEREIYDLMGVTFTGHPDLRRLQMPDDWNGYPHRRDYPLGYETVMFSFNVDEIMKHKPFAKE